MSMWMMRRWTSGKLLEPEGEEPQAPGERAQHGLAELGAYLDECLECFSADGLQRAVGLGGSVCDARRRGVDQRRLAEHAARPQALDHASADRDADAAFGHRVHKQALLAFGDDRGALLIEDRRIV